MTLSVYQNDVTCKRYHYSCSRVGENLASVQSDVATREYSVYSGTVLYSSSSLMTYNPVNP